MMYQSPAPPDKALITLAGRERSFCLRIPPAIRDLPLRLPVDVILNEKHHIRRMGLILAAAVASVDGGIFSRDLRLTVQHDPRALAALLTARAHFFDYYRNRGLCILTCPDCENGRVEIDLAGFYESSGKTPWPIANPDGTPGVPFLTKLIPPAVRKGKFPPAGCAVARLPSGYADGNNAACIVAFGSAVDREADARGWACWGQDNKLLEAHKEHWKYGNAGFRTLLRLTLALAAIGGRKDLTPEDLEVLPVTDVLFLDALYAYLYVLPAGKPVICPVCRCEFLAAL